MGSDAQNRSVERGAGKEVLRIKPERVPALDIIIGSGYLSPTADRGAEIDRVLIQRHGQRSRQSHRQGRDPLARIWWGVVATAATAATAATSAVCCRLILDVFIIIITNFFFFRGVFFFRLFVLVDFSARTVFDGKQSIAETLAGSLTDL